MRIKICGITNGKDACAVAAAGADAIGLVFYDPSPRCVGIARAREIAAATGPFVTLVGLFVNADKGFVERVLEQVPLHLLQFHGDESPEYCERFNRPYMKALRMKPELAVTAAMARYPAAAGILLDAYHKGVPGGTGETFDWNRVPRNSGRPIVLAGGLTPDNIARAVAATRPYGVDVSGGVESAPGRKDIRKVARFIENAREGGSRTSDVQLKGIERE